MLLFDALALWLGALTYLAVAAYGIFYICIFTLFNRDARKFILPFILILFFDIPAYVVWESIFNRYEKLCLSIYLS